MAWTNIPDSVLEPGKPIRSVDGLSLRDNPIAIANGDPGAPRINGSAAIAADTIDFQRLNHGPIFGAATRSAGIRYDLTYGDSSGTSFVELSIDTPGEFPVQIMASWTADLLDHWVRIFRNGGVILERDQQDPSKSLFWPDLSVGGGVTTYRLEFERPSGGVTGSQGCFTVICPIR